jgi:SOS-response transcriptional repressor LexA
MVQDARPSKKQRELLTFIEGFIKGNGYGPSYREIMRALDYKSVSTVAVHVDGLIAHGLLHKKDNSARSLEIASTKPEKSPRDMHIEWLERELKKRETDGAKKEAELLRQVLALFQKD